MELNDENIIKVLEELLPYIEADGGSLQYVETEDGYVKVRLGGACETCAMSVMTLKQGIEKKLMMEIPDIKGVIQVLQMNIEEQFELGDLLLEERKCRVCGETKNLIDGFYKTHKNRLSLPSSYAYECKACTIKRIVASRKNKKPSNEWIYPDW